MLAGRRGSVVEQDLEGARVLEGVPVRRPELSLRSPTRPGVRTPGPRRTPRVLASVQKKKRFMPPRLLYALRGRAPPDKAPFRSALEKTRGLRTNPHEDRQRASTTTYAVITL